MSSLFSHTRFSHVAGYTDKGQYFSEALHFIFNICMQIHFGYAENQHMPRFSCNSVNLEGFIMLLQNSFNRHTYFDSFKLPTLSILQSSCAVFQAFVMLRRRRLHNFILLG